MRWRLAARRVGVGSRGCGLREQRPRQGEARRATGGREIAEVPDADEAAREHMLHEAPQKLHRRERHRARLITVRVVLPLKGDVLAVKGAQPMVADRDAMRVAPEIPEHSPRAAEGGLRVHDPVGVEEGVDEGVPLRRVLQVLAP